MRTFRSRGSGQIEKTQFRHIGSDVIIESGALVFHPENISLGNNVYLGFNSILEAYHVNEMKIGSNVWIGPQCYFHSAGGLTIGDRVGIGAGVRILTSVHSETPRGTAIMDGPLSFAPVEIGEDSDIGVGSILLPGVRIGRGVQVGAGAVVTNDLPDYAVAAGVPARVLRVRSEKT